MSDEVKRQRMEDLRANVKEWQRSAMVHEVKVKQELALAAMAWFGAVCAGVAVVGVFVGTWMDSGLAEALITLGIIAGVLCVLTWALAIAAVSSPSDEARGLARFRHGPPAGKLVRPGRDVNVNPNPAPAEPPPVSQVKPGAVVAANDGYTLVVPPGTSELRNCVSASLRHSVSGQEVRS